MKILFVLLFIVFQTKADECIDRFEQSVKDLSLQIDQDYRSQTAGEYGIKHFGHKLSNEAIFLKGNKKVIILYHGFMASPYEMYPIGQHLNEKLGVSVYIPMIPGFGAHHAVNSLYTYDDWQTSIEQNINLAKTCFNDIGLIGYSIGAGILTHYLLKSNAYKDIKFVSLLAPFIKGHWWQMTLLGPKLKKKALSGISKYLKLKKVNLDKFHRYTVRIYRDIDIILEDPDHYTQNFSVDSAQALMDITANLKSIDSKHKIDIPVHLAYSESDLTINYRYAKKYIKKHFSSYKNAFVFPKKEKVPHEIVVPHENLNPNYQLLYDDIVNFIQKLKF